MASSVKISDNMLYSAQIIAKVLNRSVAGQIEYWAKIGKIAEENPDLTYDMIKDLLISLQESEHGNLEEYKFG
jgi:hypothetical protein